eukprot:g3037.t1
MASGFDIHDAARRGNIATITTYIRAGGDLYAQDREGNPPLHVASRHGREASVAAFLGAGVDPAAVNTEGRTPLYYAVQNGHMGCAALLRGEAPPTPRSKSCSPTGEQQQKQQQAGYGGDDDDERDQRKKKKNKDKNKNKNKDKDRGKSSTASGTSDKKENPSFFAEDDDLAAAPAAAVAAAPPSVLPPPPPPTAPSTAAQEAAENSQLDDGAVKSDWHLCHDEHGNAYYYSETTGHGYYLHESSATSVWAGVDGSFPGVRGDPAAPEGAGTVPASDGERVVGCGGEGGNAGDACADWDAGILMAEASAAGRRPAPTAPPQLSSAPELAELQQAGPSEVGAGGEDGMEEGEDEEDEEEDEEEDTSMLLCTQGILSTNDFFAAQQLQIYPSCSGGSPMASAPPAAESGGRRSSCSPLPASGGGDDNNKMWATSPTAAGVTAEGDGESVPGESYDGTEGQARSFVNRTVPSPSETGVPPTTGDWAEPGEGPRPYPEGTPPPAVRVGVWDTAAVASSDYSPVSSSQSNHFNIKLSGSHSTAAVTRTAAQKQRQSQPASGGYGRYGHGDDFSSRVPVTPSKYDILLEKPEAAVAAQASGGGSTSGGGFYPKLLDRSGFSGGYPYGDGDGGGGGAGSGLQEDCTGGNVGKTGDQPNGTPRTNGLDGSLARAAERGLFLGENRVDEGGRK